MSSDQGQSGGAEQRRFARVPIKLDALIAIGTNDPVACTIRDFCVGGMFVTADPAAYASVPPDTPAILYFALIVGGEKQDYQVRLVIARAVAKGIGVSFADPEPQTLDVLSQLAAPMGMPTLPENAAEIGRSQEGFAPEFALVEAPLKALITESVKTICERFLERVDDVLFLSARDAGNNADETRYLDGQRELRGRQEIVRDEVPQKVALGVSILGNPRSDQDKESKAPGLSGLSLIEKDEFEEFLAVSEIVSELEPEFSEDLFQLGRRMTYLANREIDVSAIPIGPGVMCNAIADSLKGLQSDQPVVSKVYKMLHESMSKDLGEMYQAVNALLIEHAILPVIDKDTPVLKRRSSAATGFDAPVADALDDTLGQPATPVEEQFSDLMPSPDAYRGQPSGHVVSAPPAYPQGGVQAAPPAYPQGGVQAAPPAYPQGGVQAAPPAHPQGGEPCPI